MWLRELDTRARARAREDNYVRPMNTTRGAAGPPPLLGSRENDLKGAGADLTKIQPAGIRTKSGGARSIEAGKGPAGSGLSLGVAGVENGGRKDATFLRPPW
jgi:hypothetical protein